MQRSNKQTDLSRRDWQRWPLCDGWVAGRSRVTGDELAPGPREDGAPKTSLLKKTLKRPRPGLYQWSWLAWPYHSLPARFPLASKPQWPHPNHLLGRISSQCKLLDRAQEELGKTLSGLGQNTPGISWMVLTGS